MTPWRRSVLFAVGGLAAGALAWAQASSSDRTAAGMAALLVLGGLSLVSVGAARWRTPFLVLHAGAVALVLMLVVGGGALNHYVGLAALVLLLPLAGATWLLALRWLAQPGDHLG